MIARTGYVSNTLIERRPTTATITSSALQASGTPHQIFVQYSGDTNFLQSNNQFTEAATKALGTDLDRAFREIGFCTLVGHGVPQALIDRLFAEAARFFALPPEVKAEVAVRHSPCHRGWPE